MIMSLLLIVGGILIISACVGLWRFGDRKNIVYARLHMAGVIDVICIYLMLALDQPLVAFAYLILVPVSVHAIANARYYGGKKC